jgi:hypothetical protein
MFTGARRKNYEQKVKERVKKIYLSKSAWALALATIIMTTPVAFFLQHTAYNRTY